MPIQSTEEAAQVARLIQAGKITGAGKDAALADLRAFDTQQTSGAEDRRPDAPAGTFVDPQTGQPVTTTTPGAPKGGNWLTGGGQRMAEPIIEAAEGVGDLVGSFATKSASADYKQMVDKRRDAYYNANPEDSRTVNALAASAVPIGGAAGATTRTEGYLMALARQMGIGAIAGGSQYTPEGGSKGMQIGAGALFGGLMQGVGGALPAAKNLVARNIQKAESAFPRITEAVKEAGSFFTGSAKVPEPAPYSVGQSTGAPNAIRLEQAAAGPEQQNLRASQFDQVRTRFNELADQAGNASKLDTSAPAVAGAVNTTLRNTTLQMRSARNVGFQAGMQDVATLAGPSGGPGLVPLTNLTNAYESILRQDANAFNIHGTTLPSGVEATLDSLKKAPGARVKIPTLQYILQGIGQDAPHGAGVFLTQADARTEMYRQQLKAALEKDIDTAGIKPGTNAAFDKLQDVRKTYAQQSDQLRTLEDGALNKLFGSPDKLATPQAALDAFHGMRSADQVTSVDLLSKNHPEVLDAMRAHQLRTAITDATGNGPAKTSTFDLQKFNETMFGGDKANSPLWGGNTDVEKAMRAGASHLRVLMNTPGGGPGMLVTPADVAMNLVSMNPIFASRLVSRIVYAGYGDKLLGTPEGLAAIRTLSNTSSRSRAAVSQAMTYLTGLAGQQQPAAPGAQ